MGTSHSSTAETTSDHTSYGHVDYAVLERLLRHVRSDRLRAEFLKTPEADYTKKSEVRIWVSTFNLNGRKPPENLDFHEYMKKWEASWPAREVHGAKDDRKPDIYVMGFQEAVPLNAQNIIAGWTNIPVGWDRSIDRSLNKWKKEEELVHSPSNRGQSEDEIIEKYHAAWTGEPSANLTSRVAKTFKIQEHSFSEIKDDDNKETKKETSGDDLISFDDESTPEEHVRPAVMPKATLVKPSLRKKEHEEYVQIISHQLVGLYMTGWARKSILKRISGIQITTVATGALGYLANKGAIAARMRIDDSAFVFLTSHFASGSHEGDELKRNLDFSEIVRRTQFPREVSLVKVTKEDGTTVEDFSSHPDGLPENASSEVKRSFIGGHWECFRTLREMDNIIWVGDLNYRIVGSAKEVIKLIRENKLNALLEVDELRVQKAAGKVFQGFQEVPIDFPPTYKFIRGTDYYTGEIDEEMTEDSETEDKNEETSEEASKALSSFPVAGSFVDNVGRQTSISSTRNQEVMRTFGRLGISTRNLTIVEDSNPGQMEHRPTITRRGSEGDLTRKSVTSSKEEKKSLVTKKIRTPSWTDRILFYSSRKTLHHLLYGIFSTLLVSDHRPVVGAFLFEAKKFDEEAVDCAVQEARRIIDLEEMAAIPRCSLSPTVINIGNMLYRKPMEFPVCIENTGEVPATYSFIPAASGRQSSRSPFPTWLSAQPTSGVIKAGKKEQVKIKVSIEGGQWGSADELFGNPSNTLDHILVLHIEGGSDFFISIVGTYSLSCFGLSLHHLALHLPPNDSRYLEKIKALKSMVLPSLEQRNKSADLTLMMANDSNASVEGNVASVAFSKHRLNSSASLSRTGPQANLVVGPTGLMIPTHVLRMLHYLSEEGRLKTPKLFVESWKRVVNGFEHSNELESVVSIRQALDQGVDFPSQVSSHDMAGALLTFFYDLPSPMIPESIAQTCEMSDVSAMMAITLLEEAMSAVEWGVFDSTMEIMRSLLLEQNAQANQLNVHDLADTLSQAFFQYIKKTPKHSMRRREETHEMNPKLKVLHDRRCKFIEYSLKMDHSADWLDVKDPSEQSYRSL